MEHGEIQGDIKADTTHHYYTHSTGYVIALI